MAATVYIYEENLMHQGSILSYFHAKHAISVKPLDLFTGEHRQLDMHVYFILKELATYLYIAN